MKVTLGAFRGHFGVGLLWPSEIKSFYTFTNLNPWSQRFQCTELGVPVAGLPPHVLQEGAGDGDDGGGKVSEYTTCDGDGPCGDDCVDDPDVNVCDSDHG